MNVQRKKIQNGLFMILGRSSNENADRVSSKKYLDVEGDYYYRVRCIHSAGQDMSSSFTNGVYIEEP